MNKRNINTLESFLEATGLKIHTGHLLISTDGTPTDNYKYVVGNLQDNITRIEVSNTQGVYIYALNENGKEYVVSHTNSCGDGIIANGPTERDALINAGNFIKDVIEDFRSNY